jgi:hypothetical protein
MFMATSTMSNVGLGLQAGAQFLDFFSKAGAASINADLARLEAEMVQEQAREAEAKKRKEVDALVGRQKAMAAKSGFTLADSHADVIAETVYEGELDALGIRRYGAGQAAAKNIQASSYDSMASSYYLASFLAPAGTALSGMSKHSWMGKKQKNAMLNNKWMQGEGSIFF